MTKDEQPPSIQQSLDLAVQHHTAGRLAEAEKLYQQILQVDPDQPVPLHLLGVIHYQVGKHDIAVDLINRALAISPDYVDALTNLGNVLQAKGKFDQAVASYRKALALSPDFVLAHYNMGSALQELGKLDEAVESFQNAISLSPGYAEAHSNLGNVLSELGKLDEAVASFQKAIDLKPDLAEAHNNLGNSLKNLGKMDEAIASFNKAIAIKPRFAEAHNNMGNVLSQLGKLDEAVISIRIAISLKPDFAEAHCKLGGTLQQLGKMDEAMRCYESAIAIKPDYSMTYYNQAILYQERGQLEDAIAAYRKALDIDPDYEMASTSLLHQLRQACAWGEVDELEVKVREFTEHSIRTGSGVALEPFDNIVSNSDAAENYPVAQAKSRKIMEKMSSLNTDFQFPTGKSPGDKITVGYLSSDFHNHATAHLMLSLFELHDRKDFNIFTFSYGRNDGSDYRKKIINDSDSFFDLQTANHLDAAKEIYRSGVDILVDLKGHTRKSRLEICALRPAPVQVAYLGFPGTSGADFLDFILTDKIVTPEDQSPYYSEKFVYLPDCYQINDAEQEISNAPVTKQEAGLPDEGFVFCSFNTNYKIEPVIFDVWMNLLKQVPGSVLWLFKGNALAENNLKNQAQVRGVDGSRLIFAPHMPKDQHLARYRLADLVLDTRICCGHTTTSDALWAGIPVVTMQGDHFASRVSASILRAVGLPELISHNLEDYEALALRLSRSPHELADLKSRLAHNRLTKPLFDTSRFVKNLEDAYRRMWESYLSDEPLSAIDLNEK
jgi:protein O-GlcNAc transferase